MSSSDGGTFDRAPTGFLLRLAHQYARTAANKALKPLDLDLRHVGVLAALAGAGPLTQRQLISGVELDKSSMVYVVDKLEQSGLVIRERTPADRRAYAVTLTSLGRKRLAEAGRIATDVMTELLDTLEPSEVEQLNSLLRRVIERARQRASDRRGNTERQGEVA
jgi:DNA-binding MarR family transcriptional regulator